MNSRDTQSNACHDTQVSHVTPRQVDARNQMQTSLLELGR